MVLFFILSIALLVQLRILLWLLHRNTHDNLDCGENSCIMRQGTFNRIFVMFCDLCDWPVHNRKNNPIIKVV